MKVFAAAADAWKTGRRAALATVIGAGGSTPRVSGARMLVYEDGTSVGTVGGGELEHRAIAAAVQSISDGRPARLEVHLTRDLGMCCGGRMEVFIEPLHVREPVVLFGAGHVGHAVARALVDLEFAVTVVDARDEWATEQRFPGCAVHVGDPRAYAASLSGDPRAYRLVMTHDHKLDQDLIEALLPLPCAWIGLIGSRAKVAKFLIRYRAAGMDEALFQRLSSPVGLDIGAETPAEIAVAVAAEMIRVRRGVDRPPQPLSEIPLTARGGDGRARAPALARQE